MSTHFRKAVIAAASTIVLVSGLMLLLAGQQSNTLPDTGDEVMLVLSSPSGDFEWDGPFSVVERKDDGLVVLVHGTRTLVDFPEAIPLDTYRSMKHETE